MQPTTYPHINELLKLLLAQMQAILGDKLVGLYLYGSLVAGDFDEDTSDIDLLAAIASDLDEAEFNALNEIQNELVRQYPQWNDRVEIAYLSLHGLKTFKTERSKLGIISPGEPFHIIEAGKDWLMNWYMVRETGVTLFGPPPTTIIEPVSKDEYIQAVRSHVTDWRKIMLDDNPRPFQAYSILTMCRALYTLRYGEQPSKLKAAQWAMQELPDWSPLIQQALQWRKAYKEKDVDDAATMPETRRFVYYVIERIEGQ